MFVRILIAFLCAVSAANLLVLHDNEGLREVGLLWVAVAVAMFAIGWQVLGQITPKR